MDKVEEKIKRTKYIRVLEKFARQTILLIRHTNFDIELFASQVKKNAKVLDSVEKIRLDSQYLKKLIEFCDKTIISINNLESFNKDALIKEANLLHKEKNKNSYKKDKYAKQKFNDGY